MVDDSNSAKPRAVEIISRKRVFDGFFKVDEARLRVERFDGRMGGEINRLTVERGDAVAALIHDPARDALLFVNQFRLPTLEMGPGWLLELVAGMVDPGETPEDAIRREAAEEAGVEITALTPIARFYSSPGGLSERVHLFAAEASLAAMVPQSDDGEDIELVVLSLDEAAHKLAAAGFEDAKTIIGLQHFFAKRGQSI